MKTDTPAAVTHYIESEPAEARKMLKQMRAIMRKAAPKASEKLAWGMPTLYLEGILITFAAFTKHVSIFPGPDALKYFAKDIAKYKTSKGTLQIPFGEKVPAGLITKMVKFGVKRNLAHAAAKAKKKKAKAKTRPR